MILPINKIKKAIQKVILTISLGIWKHKKALKQKLRALRI